MDIVVEFQEALQNFFSGFGGDGVADAVVFRQVINFIKIMGKVNVHPAVSFEDGFVHFPVQAAQFDDAFETAEVEEREFEAVPDGKYQVNVDRVELTRAQTSGNPMLKWTLRILAPNHKGRLLWRNNVMASNENIKWLKQDLFTCGLQLQRLSDLPGQLEQLLNVKLEVTKRTRGENENIYLNRRIVLADDVGAPGAAMDDMIPF